MVQIKFTTFGATSAGGSFGPGDVLRCSEEMANHLVNEAKCAVFVKAQEPSEPVQVQTSKRVRKSKEQAE